MNDVPHKVSGRGATRYEIVVRGELSDRFASEFEGMELKAGKGWTVLVGEVFDQCHPHGLIYRLRDFGLELVRVEALGEREGE